MTRGGDLGYNVFVSPKNKIIVALNMAYSGAAKL
jgi:hypothetical protein